MKNGYERRATRFITNKMISNVIKLNMLQWLSQLTRTNRSRIVGSYQKNQKLETNII